MGSSPVTCHHLAHAVTRRIPRAIACRQPVIVKAHESEDTMSDWTGSASSIDLLMTGLSGWRRFLMAPYTFRDIFYLIVQIALEQKRP